MSHPLPPILGFIQADVTMRRAEDDGRRAAIRTGYRPNSWLPAEAGHIWAGGTVDLVHQSELGPGEVGAIRIYPLLPEEWERVAVGAFLEPCEGPLLVGKASVTLVALSAGVGRCGWRQPRPARAPVSYTHLTLPTKRIV